MGMNMDRGMGGFGGGFGTPVGGFATPGMKAKQVIGAPRKPEVPPQKIELPPKKEEKPAEEVKDKAELKEKTKEEQKFVKVQAAADIAKKLGAEKVKERKEEQKEKIQDKKEQKVKDEGKKVDDRKIDDRKKISEDTTKEVVKERTEQKTDKLKVTTQKTPEIKETLGWVAKETTPVNLKNIMKMSAFAENPKLSEHLQEIQNDQRPTTPQLNQTLKQGPLKASNAWLETINLKRESPKIPYLLSVSTPAGNYLLSQTKVSDLTKDTTSKSIDSRELIKFKPVKYESNNVNKLVSGLPKMMEDELKQLPDSSDPQVIKRKQELRDSIKAVADVRFGEKAPEFEIPSWPTGGFIATTRPNTPKKDVQRAFAFQRRLANRDDSGSTSTNQNQMDYLV